MHYSVIVVTKQKPTDAVIAREMDRCRRHWDWFQIGGRWTGHFDGYDPHTDPDNIEVCEYCKGTGKRNDATGKQARAKNPNYTCNVCNGEGKHVKWPTQFAPHGGDSVQVKDLPNDYQIRPTYAVVKSGVWDDGGLGLSFGKDIPEKKVWFDQQIKALSPEDYLTIVDCHN